jgi:hypothetical protein
MAGAQRYGIDNAIPEAVPQSTDPRESERDFRFVVVNERLFTAVKKVRAEKQPESVPLMYDSRMHRLLRARVVAPLLHVFLFALSWLPIFIRPQVPVPSYWVFPLGLADFPISFFGWRGVVPF